MNKKHSVPKPDSNGPSRAPSFPSVFTTFFVSIMLLFALHRGLAFGILGADLPSGSRAAACLVGSLSDFWVAQLLAIIFALPLIAFSWLSVRFVQFMKIFLINLTAFALALHQGYVEFFQFQLEPFHLKYLTDVQFMTSNAASFFSGPNILMMTTGLVISLAPLVRRPYTLSRACELGIVSAIVLAGIVAHNRNIHLRVQWFVPENLQTNVLETFYLRSKRPQISERLGPAVFRKAMDLYGNGNGSAPATSEQFYDRTIFSGSFQANSKLHPIATAIQEIFREKIQTKTKPIILIVLLESLRPSETGLFIKDKPTLTENLDRLAEDGIWFSKAYATGSVTRSGQEAVLCGNFSGRNSSLMRNYPTLRYNCLTDEFAKNNADLFWYHGGDGRFDGQEQFWRKHGISDVKTMLSYPADSPKTGWGIGDKTFFQLAANDLNRGRQQGNRPFGLGMMLSVTNHIPWDLPQDFTGPISSVTPSFVTTTYTDQGVAILEKSLKKSGDWNSVLLFIVSDHGNKTEPYGALYRKIANQKQALQSHINLIVSGGILEKARADVPMNTNVFNHYVSQADIAATIAGITGQTDFKAMGKDLFYETSTYPVLSQTEDGLYFPAEDVLVPYKQAAASLLRQDQEHWLPRFHYQAMLQYMNDLLTLGK